VVSNIFYFPFYIWDVILPIDELIFFKMVIARPTRMDWSCPVNPTGNGKISLIYFGKSPMDWFFREDLQDFCPNISWENHGKSMVSGEDFP
jgi:hypothetical protein